MNQPPTYTHKNGTKYWNNEKGELHRDNDLPAVILPNGTQEWWQNGKLYKVYKKDVYE